MTGVGYEITSGKRTPERYRCTQVGCEMRDPTIPVRLNRTETLRRFHALSVGGTTTQARRGKGEFSKSVAGRNKLASQNLGRQMRLWFRQNSLVIGTIDKRQRETYSRLLRLGKEKAAIREQMDKARMQRQAEEMEKEAEAAERAAGQDTGRTSHVELRSKEAGIDSTKVSDSEPAGPRPRNRVDDRTEPGHHTAGRSTTPTEPPGGNTANPVNEKPTQPSSEKTKLPGDAISRERPQQSRHSRRRSVGALARPTASSAPPRRRSSVQEMPVRWETEEEFIDQRKTPTPESKLPSVHERYLKMFDSHPKMLSKSNDGERHLPAVGTPHQQPQSTAPKNGRCDSEVNCPAAEQKPDPDLLNILEDKKATAGVHAKPRHPVVQNGSRTKRSRSPRRPASPRDRLRRVLDREPIPLYRQDRNGNIVLEHFPYRRKEFALPEKKNESFYEKLIQREKQTLQSRHQEAFTEIVQELHQAGVAEEFALQTSRPTSTTSQQIDGQENYAQLGSLGDMYRAFKQDWSILKGLNPNSSEALRLCRYLRLKEEQGLAVASAPGWNWKATSAQG